MDVQSARAVAPLRLTRRGRVVVVLLALAVLTVAVSVARVASSAAGPRLAPVAARTHVVAPGETLWGIARAWKPDGDPRVAVARLVAYNHLSSPALVPGQSVRLP